MRALLDMPVSASLISVLEAHGHEGVHVQQLGLYSAKDKAVMKRDCLSVTGCRICTPNFVNGYY